MNNLSTAERRTLELMKKDNFRGISKENVLQLVSILDKVDPEVAKELIAKMPEVIRGTVECVKNYNGVLEKGIDSFDYSSKSCYETEDMIVSALRNEIDKDGTSFEEKKYYIDKMEDAAKRKEEKDSEHKEYVTNILKFAGDGLKIAVVAIICAFLGKADIKLPSKRSA